MTNKVQSIIWSSKAEEDLDEILEHYLEYAPDAAHQRILNIIEGVEKLLFTEQYQVDEYDPSCRRMIVDERFRVLYQPIEKGVLISQVYPSKKDPKGLRKSKH
jgi:plasmid stabilization system protein ParE